MLMADRMDGNFFAIAKTADPTCFEPPYFRLPATITFLSDFTILPETPSISFNDLVFGFEKTKFV